MNRESRRLILAFAAFLCLGVLAVGLPGQVRNNQNLQVQPKPLCSDFLAALEVQKSNDGTIVLTGRISNEGPGNYSNASSALDAYFMVYTWHPPKTPAQEGDLKFYAHTDLGTAMKAKDVKVITQTYKIEKFARWGHFPISKNERLAWKQFCVRVEKKGVGFTLCEDSNVGNTTACVDVPYMEKL
jgi:hypothetical protein